MFQQGGPDKKISPQGASDQQPPVYPSPPTPGDYGTGPGPSAASFPPSQAYPPPQPGQPVGYGYPPPPGQPMTAWYPQPGYGPTQQPYPPQQQQQQQQQTVVVMGANQCQQPVAVVAVDSYCGHIAFACFVAWCCNLLFGLIAFILAMVASSTTVSDRQAARHFGRASIGVSVAGIVVTILVVAIVVGVVVSSAASVADASYSGIGGGSSSSGSCSSSSYYIYYYSGSCYAHKSSYYGYSTCTYTVSGVYDSSTGYCYYD